MENVELALLDFVLICFHYRDKTLEAKDTWGGKGLFHSTTMVHDKGKSGQELNPKP